MKRHLMLIAVGASLHSTAHAGNYQPYGNPVQSGIDSYRQVQDAFDQRDRLELQRQEMEILRRQSQKESELLDLQIQEQRERLKQQESERKQREAEKKAVQNEDMDARMVDFFVKHPEYREDQVLMGALEATYQRLGDKPEHKGKSDYEVLLESHELVSKRLKTKQPAKGGTP